MVDKICADEICEMQELGRQLAKGLDYGMKLARGDADAKGADSWDWLDELKKEAEVMRSGN